MTRYPQARGVTLVLGGVRSGKSEIAEEIVASVPARDDAPVTYVAPGAFPDAGESWEARIAAHQARRPESWKTIEVGDPHILPDLLGSIDGPALVDSLGAWVAASLDGLDIEPLLSALERRRSSGQVTVLVSDEVGLGVHPPTEIGVRFQDLLGTLNRRISAIADDVHLVVAGRVLTLPTVGDD
jgi:adenosylcobinamide kinase/adenosylcobinamide-phosphate guanylyltransferase